MAAADSDTGPRVRLVSHSIVVRKKWSKTEQRLRSSKVRRYEFKGSLAGQCWSCNCRGITYAALEFVLKYCPPLSAGAVTLARFTRHQVCTIFRQGNCSVLGGVEPTVYGYLQVIQARAD